MQELSPRKPELVAQATKLGIEQKNANGSWKTDKALQKAIMDFEPNTAAEAEIPAAPETPPFPAAPVTPPVPTLPLKDEEAKSETSTEDSSDGDGDELSSNDLDTDEQESGADEGAEEEKSTGIDPEEIVPAEKKIIFDPQEEADPSDYQKLLVEVRGLRKKNKELEKVVAESSKKVDASKYEALQAELSATKKKHREIIADIAKERLEPLSDDADSK